MAIKLAHIRRNYQKSKLLEENLHSAPFLMFENWFGDALTSGEIEPNAMVLSTVTNNKPSARVVLLKEMSEETFLFFTNYNSRKGNEMDKNPFVSLTFFWPKLERQVRIEGIVEKVPESISSDYFDSRPEESRISAIISAQSKVIPSRKYLEDLFSDFKEKELPIQKPTHWGGYRCIPLNIEFWQGGEHRLHDRIRYTKAEGDWITERLSP
jgi:pyridoxamine 5'-phosphate oxidase